MDYTKQDQSLGALLRELTSSLTLLFRQEVELAKTEIGEKAALAGRNVGAIAIGGAITLLGGLALLAAVITRLGALLDTFLPTGVAGVLAPLLVGGPRVLRLLRAYRRLATLRNEGLCPTQTKETCRRTPIDQGRIS